MGGHLLMNAGPNEGGNIDLGFGGFTLQYNLAVTGNTEGIVQVSGHPAFNGPLTPANGNFTGGYFAHGIVAPVGTTFTTLLKGENDGRIVIETPYGSGLVAFGGLATPNFHTPTPNSYNWISNFHTYLSQAVDKAYLVVVSTDDDGCEYTAVDGALDPAITDPCNIGYTIFHDYAGAPNTHTLDGTVFASGDHTVKWTIEDVNGNTYVRSTIVRVEDGTAPVVSCVADQSLDADAGASTYTHSGIAWDAVATDNCTESPSVTYELTGATTGTGTTLDGVVFNLGETTVTWTATDDAGNTDICSFTVTVSDNENPVVTCVDNQLVNTDADDCTYTHTGTGWDATATDNCTASPMVAYVLDGATTGTGTTLDGVVFNPGETTVTWTATDDAGNTHVCSFNVMVLDENAPTVLTQNIIVALDASGQTTITPEMVDGGSHDACGIATWMLSKTTFNSDDLGSNTVTLTATDQNGNESDPVPATVVVVAFDNNSFIYDGTAQSLAIAGDLPSGVDVTYTGNGQTDVGVYTVTATIDGGDDFNDLVLTAELEIIKASLVGVVTLDGESFVYDGTARSLTISGTLPAGAEVEYVGNGQTEAGVYTVTATIDGGNNYENLELTADLTIDPAGVTGITLDDASFIYDGTAKSLAIDGTLPDGTSVSYTNNSRTDAGTQEVTATITGDNYQTLVLTADLTVTPASITGITLQDASFVYDGTARSLAIDGTLPGGTSVSYTNNSRTDAGTQEVTATITGDNYQTLVLTADLIIIPATITGITLEDASFVYDGTAKSLAIDGTLPDGTSVSYTNNSRTDAGTQEVTATVTGDNYQTLVLTADLAITPASVTGIMLEDASFVYDGTARSLVISGTLPDGTSVSYANNSRTDTGTQEVTATVTGDNYQTLVLTADLTVTLATITGITLQDESFIYDGTARSLVISGTLPDGTSVSYTNNSRTDAGTQEITATVTGDNYQTLVLTADLIITPASITSITLEDASFVYDGTAKSLAIDGTLPAGTSVSYTTNSRTDAGTQEVTATVTGDNYQTLVLTAQLTITPAQRALSFPALPSKTFGDADFAADASLSSGEPVSYSSSNTAVAQVVNGLIHIVGAGTATITATAPDNSNYANRPTADQLLTVRKASQQITFAVVGEVNRDAGTIPLNASASSGLPVSLSLDDPQVASLTGHSLSILRLGTVRITARQDGNTNYEAAIPVTITVHVVDPDSDAPVRVHQAVSPNGDGINEFLMIEGVRDYPENRVTIFNRNGTILWQASGYDNGRVAFRGIGTGQQRLPVGTYFYQIEVKDKNTWKQLKGYFVLRY